MITLSSQINAVNLNNRALYRLLPQPTTHILHVHSTPQGLHASHQMPPSHESMAKQEEDLSGDIESLTKRLRKIDKLFMNEFLSDEEYSHQKNAILTDMTFAVDERYPEDGLMIFAQLREEGLIDERDFKKLKGVLLS